MSEYGDLKTFCNVLFPEGELRFAAYGGIYGPAHYFSKKLTWEAFTALSHRNSEGADIYILSNKSNGGYHDKDMISFDNSFADLDVGRQPKENGGGYFHLEIVKEKKKQILAKLSTLIKSGLVCPTMIVDTRNGYQLWFKLSEPIKEERDFENLQAAIVERLIKEGINADKTITNASRVMRCPGFFWKKISENLPPYLCTIHKLFPAKIYSYQQMVQCFPITESITQHHKTLNKNGGYRTGVQTTEPGHYWISFAGKEPFETEAFYEGTQLHAECKNGCGDPKGHDLVFYNDGGCYCNRCREGAFVTKNKEDLYWFKNAEREKAWKERIIPARKANDISLLQTGDEQYIKDYLGHTGRSLTVEDYINENGKPPVQDNSSKTIPLSFHLTEAGNAERLRNTYGDKLRYICELGKWANYQGGKWDLRTGDKVACYYALKIAKKIEKEEAEKISDKAIKKKYKNWARLSENNAKINNTLSIAQFLFPFQCYQKDFDQDPTLLNCKNGTINLGTGELLAHSPQHMITQIIDINYNPQAECPIWLAALDKYMLGNKEMITYLQQLAGICLLGRPERIFPIFYGLGKNGKSVYIDTLLTILGDYGWHAPESFLQQKDNSNNLAIANLKGKRLVCLSETKKNMELDASLVKSMTGDNQLNGRFLYNNFFEFTPTHIAILITQNLPVIKESSSGIWDRIQQVNWQYRITEEEEDRKFMDKLKPEYEGILYWMVQGALSYQKNGLHIPEQIKLNTQDYKNESGLITEFIEEHCVVEFDHEQRLQKRDRHQYQSTIGRKELYNEYKKTEKFPLAPRKFAREMTDLGFKTHKSGNTRHWLGIAIKDNGNGNNPRDNNTEEDSDFEKNFLANV